MSILQGTFTNGVIRLDEPAALVEGQKVRIETDEMRWGISEADWPTDEAGIQALLKRLDAIEPWMSDEEAIEWETQLAERKDEQKRLASENLKSLENLFE